MTFRAKLHRNLNAPGGTVEWSVTPLEGSLRGRVVAYARAAFIEDAYFRVQPAACRRIRARGTRCVCAWVEGRVSAMEFSRIRLNWSAPDILVPPPRSIPSGERVILDIFGGNNHFSIEATGEMVTTARHALLTSDGKCFKGKCLPANYRK